MEEKGRILVADDLESHLESIAEILRRAGYVVDTALDGYIAADMIRKNEYDVLVADIIMDGNSKLELIKLLPELAEGLQAVLITGNPSHQTAAEGYDLPVAGYVEKPIDYEELFARVDRAIRKYRAHRRLSGVRRELGEWRRTIDEAMAARQDEEAVPVSVDSYVAIGFGNIVRGLTELRTLTQRLIGEGEPTPACRLFHCPRIDAIMNELEETIEMLLETKRYARVPLIAKARAKLEGVVQELRDSYPGTGTEDPNSTH